MQIGELVGNLSEELKKDYSEIPWRNIKDMRNLYAHAYSLVDNELVWSTLKKDIPEFNEKCSEIMKQI